MPETPRFHKFLRKGVLLGTPVVLVIFVVGTAMYGQAHRSTSVPSGFTTDYESARFLIRSNTRAPNTTLAATAERAHYLALATFHKGDVSRSDKRLLIYVCENVDDVAAVERHYRISPAATPESRNTLAGGYYHDVPMIAVSAPSSRLNEIISHEIAHSVVEREVPSCPPFVNEGAAMYVAEMTLASDVSLSEEWSAFMRKWRGACADAAASKFDLMRLSSVTAPERGRRAYDKTFYAVAWCFVRTVVRLDGGDGGKRMASLMERLAKGRDARTAMSEIDDVMMLEREVSAELERLAAQAGQASRDR